MMITVNFHEEPKIDFVLRSDSVGGGVAERVVFGRIEGLDYKSMEIVFEGNDVGASSGKTIQIEHCEGGLRLQVYAGVFDENAETDIFDMPPEHEIWIQKWSQGESNP